MPPDVMHLEAHTTTDAIFSPKTNYLSSDFKVQPQSTVTKV